MAEWSGARSFLTASPEAAAFNGPAGSSHIGGAWWLYDDDRELYNLLESLHGPIRQEVTKDPPPSPSGPVAV